MLSGERMRLPESLNTIATRLTNADLTQQEEEVRRAILRAFARRGKSPKMRDIITLIPGLGEKEVVDICHKLAEKDLIIWEEAEQCVQSAYPFSGLPTVHKVHLIDGPETYALCAVDALGMPVMLGQRAHIVSRCAHCDTGIEVTVTPEELEQYRPPESVVWFPLAEDVCCPVAQSRCPDINFFCSTEHGDTWWKTRDRPEGLWMTMGEAFDAGREIFGLLLMRPKSIGK